MYNPQKRNGSLINKQIVKMTAKEVVEAYSIALGKGDIPTAFSYFSPDAKWHQPGKISFQEHKMVLKLLAGCCRI